MVVLANLLRETRVAAGLTQAQAATAVGMTQAMLSDVEAGHCRLELLIVRDLVNIYGMGWLDFVGMLEARFAAAPEPSAPLIRRGRLRSGQ